MSGTIHVIYHDRYISILQVPQVQDIVGETGGYLCKPLWALIPVYISPKLLLYYTIFYQGPLQWHLRGPKVAILFASTTLLNLTILLTRFYGT